MVIKLCLVGIRQYFQHPCPSIGPMTSSRVLFLFRINVSTSKWFIWLYCQDWLGTASPDLGPLGLSFVLGTASPVSEFYFYFQIGIRV